MMVRAATALLCLALGGCALLPGGGKAGRQASVYLFEQADIGARSEPVGCHVIVVGEPEPAPGFSSAQMLYQRAANRVERFAFSRWVESPASMLAPLLVNGLQSSNAFGTVLASPAPLPADVRVESEGFRLLQKFEGDRSEVELQLDVRVYAPGERRLLGTHRFRYREAAAAASPQAGVVASQRAVERLLSDYVDFVIRSAAQISPDCDD